MERSTTIGGTQFGTSGNPMANPAMAESAALAGHEAVDRTAERAQAQVGRIKGAAHQAVDAAADAAAQAADWAGTMTEQAKQAQVRMTEAACESIRARPLTAVFASLAVGYLLGRLARF